ncbi:MAG: multidrug effflux MFS transporter, partial [Alphaproteobacteria bacterium]|nr:multidrug effflux MFS transporter [Alphaproteobacteria bacterium]
MTLRPRFQTKRDFIMLLLVLGGIIAIGPLTIDIYLPAFSAIAADFRITASQTQLSLTSYFIGITIGQISYGPIIDRFGKKPPLFCGLVIFIAATIGCFYSNSIEQMIIFRFFQAIGACAG